MVNFPLNNMSRNKQYVKTRSSIPRFPYTVIASFSIRMKPRCPNSIHFNLFIIYFYEIDKHALTQLFVIPGRHHHQQVHQQQFFVHTQQVALLCLHLPLIRKPTKNWGNYASLWTIDEREIYKTTQNRRVPPLVTWAASIDRALEITENLGRWKISNLALLACL